MPLNPLVCGPQISGRAMRLCAARTLYFRLIIMQNWALCGTPARRSFAAPLYIKKIRENPSFRESVSKSNNAAAGDNVKSNCFLGNREESLQTLTLQSLLTNRFPSNPSISYPSLQPACQLDYYCLSQESSVLQSQIESTRLILN